MFPILLSASVLFRLALAGAGRLALSQEKPIDLPTVKKKADARECDGHGLSGKAHNNRGVVYLHHLEQYVIDRVQNDSDDQQHPSRAYPPSVNASSFGLAKPGG